MPGLPLTLEYAAPAECPAQRALTAAVENLVAADRARPLSVRVTIEKAGKAYEARINSADGSARVLSGSSCEEVVEGASVVLALAITPGAAAEEPLGGPASPAASTRPPKPDTHALLGAGARGDAGTLPHTALGFGGQLGVEHGRFSAYVAGTYWLGERTSLAAQPTLGGDFSWWTAAVTGCAAPATGVLRLDLCAGAEVGRLSGSGFGFPGTRTSATPWIAGVGSLEASWAISAGFRLRAVVGAAVPFVGRRPFLLDGARVHEPSAVAGRAEIGPEVVF